MEISLIVIGFNDVMTSGIYNIIGVMILLVTIEISMGNILWVDDDMELRWMTDRYG